MAECCMDGNFCDFPWCDCTGNAEYRRVNNITDPQKPLVWDEAKRAWTQEPASVAAAAAGTHGSQA